MFLSNCASDNSNLEHISDTQEFKKEIQKLDSAVFVLEENSIPHSSIENDIDISKIDTIQLGATYIVIRQDHPVENYFSCNSYLTSFREEDTIKHLEFKFIESLGGLAGFSVPEITHGHIILSKEGDYDGRTIVIDTLGKIHNFIGGTNFLDPKNALLFSTYSSDMPGLAIFDLKSDSILIELEGLDDRPLSVHKAFGDRYFFLCSNDESDKTSIWEFEKDLERVMQVELDSNTVNSSNELANINTFRF